MIIADFECLACGHIEEELCDRDKHAGECVKCGCVTKKIITQGRSNLQSEENALWLRSVLEVVDHSDRSASTQAFIHNPTRSNYKAWMKDKGIRPVDYTEHGGPPVYRKPESMSTTEIARVLYERHRQRKSLNVR